MYIYIPLHLLFIILIIIKTVAASREIYSSEAESRKIVMHNLITRYTRY